MRHHSVFSREQLLTNGASGLPLMDTLVMCKWIIAAENFATLVAHIFCWTAWSCCRSWRKSSTRLFVWPLSNYRERKSSILLRISCKQKQWLNMMHTHVVLLVIKAYTFTVFKVLSFALCLYEVQIVKEIKIAGKATYPSKINHCTTSIICPLLYVKHPKQK